MAQTQTKKPAQEEDQSMEEILQSIRRIIAEDDDSEPPADNAAATAQTPDAAGAGTQEKPQPKGSDVLELTDMVTEEGAVVHVESTDSEPPPIAQAAPAAGDVLNDIDEALKREPVEAPATLETKEPDGESLLSESAAAAASQALRNLKKEPAQPKGPPLAFRSGVTVEDLVMEAMRPMLKEWMDENLPKLVERVVEKEIRKLS